MASSVLSEVEQRLGAVVRTASKYTHTHAHTLKSKCPFLIPSPAVAWVACLRAGVVVLREAFLPQATTPPQPRAPCCPVAACSPLVKAAKTSRPNGQLAISRRRRHLPSRIRAAPTSRSPSSPHHACANKRPARHPHPPHRPRLPVHPQRRHPLPPVDRPRRHPHPLPDADPPAVRRLPLDPAHHDSGRGQCLHLGHRRRHPVPGRPLSRARLVVGRAGKVPAPRLPRAQSPDLWRHAPLLHTDAQRELDVCPSPPRIVAFSC